ncbi:N-acetylglucosamine-6-phosphate deacetylase [Propionibacteriaceae bacterium G1746]|uniref:N-acetylglucosamine-6-phosphate deacetylase n=1 Tax=Aestuariimicrobium sp. G57 TaxID=3418485 RepID=UPI003C1F46AF
MNTLPRHLPGLVDLQVNGYRGLDVNDPDVTPATITALAHELWQVGTTRWLPTIVTAGMAQIERTLAAVHAAREADALVRDSIIGVHLEGPWISPRPEPRGAHDPRWIRPPDPAEVGAVLEAGRGLIRIVTLAPEVPGADEAIAALVDRGVLVSLGHSDGAPDDFARAQRLGATLSTHLGNGCAAMLPRQPNLLWTQLDLPLTPGLITDGHHCSPDFVRVAFAAKGPRAFIVSDAAALAGSPPGVYDTPVGGQVEVTPDGALRLPGTTRLAGSGSCLLDCVRTAVGWGLPVDQVIERASRTPLTLVAEPGTIESWGGDSVELDEHGTVTGTVIAGTRVF